MKSKHSGRALAAPRPVAASPVRHSPLSRLSLAGLVGLAAGAAFAQAQPADSPTQTVVVTAAGVEQKLPDALPSTSVITRAEIDASPATDLPDLLRTMTSFNVAQTGPLGSQTGVFVRGANSNQVLVLIDGTPFARADFGSAPWELIPLDQIDHVEIVRGNLSGVYGAQAVGGVVQIFTRHGDGGSAAISVGSRGLVIASGSIGRRLGDAATPLDLSATVSGQTTDGYSAANPATNPGTNPDRDPAYQSGATVRVGKTWAPGQRTAFTFLHAGTHSDYDGDTTTVQQDTLTTQMDEFSLHSDHALAPTLALHLSAGDTLVHFADPTQVDGVYPGSAWGSGRTRLLGAQLDWQATPDHGLQFQFEDRNDRYGDEFDSTVSRETKSGRVGYVGHFLDVIELQANARHDDADDYGSANTGLLALGWHVTPAWQLVGQVSTAFSAPTFSELEYAAAGTTLRPERSRDLEFGVHWQGRGWLARATWFSQRQHDLVGYDATNHAVNIGHASNRGIELAANGALGPGRLGLDATFQDARDDDTDTALVRRARTVASVNYSLPILGWDTGVWLRYNGVRADLDPSTFATVDAPSRTTIGLSTQHALSPNWTIGAKVDNLANNQAPEVLGYTPPQRQVVFTLRGRWS